MAKEVKATRSVFGLINHETPPRKARLTIRGTNLSRSSSTPCIAPSFSFNVCSSESTAERVWKMVRKKVDRLVCAFGGGSDVDGAEVAVAAEEGLNGSVGNVLLVPVENVGLEGSRSIPSWIQAWSPPFELCRFPPRSPTLSRSHPPPHHLAFQTSPQST